MSIDPNYSLGPDPSAEEAAAVIAAVERFLADTSSAAPSQSDELVSGWLRSALAEGVGSSDTDALW